MGGWYTRNIQKYLHTRRCTSKTNFVHSVGTRQKSSFHVEGIRRKEILVESQVVGVFEVITTRAGTEKGLGNRKT